jgi:iron complex outermembrane receptor protein
VPTPEIPLSFKSSSLWNYEVGARTDWFDRTLRFDVTAFFLDWKNPQISQSASNGLSLYVDNVGGSHNIGVEGTLRWLTPLTGLTIEQTGSYIEARTTTAFTDGSGNEIPEGTLFPSSPLVQAVTTISYSRMLGNWLTQASLINSLQGKSYTNIAHETSVGDYNLLGLVFNVGRLDLAGSPTLTLSVNNITNEQKLAAGFGPAPGTETPLDSIIADSSYVYTQPRSVAVRLSLSF